MTALAEAPMKPDADRAAAPGVTLRPGASATGDPTGATPNGAPPTPQILVQIQAGPDGVSVVSHLPPIKILELLCAILPDAFAATVREAQQRSPIVKPNAGILARLRRR